MIDKIDIVLSLLLYKDAIATKTTYFISIPELCVFCSLGVHQIYLTFEDNELIGVEDIDEKSFVSLCQ
jgi:hypothetical protein